VLDTNISRVEEGPETIILFRANVECDGVVERTDGDVPKLFGDEAYILEVGRASDLRSG
jgi:hypothetical protein